MSPLWTLALLCTIFVALHGQPVAVATSPAAQALGVNRESAITIRFDRDIDPGSASGAIAVFGRWSGVLPGTTSLDGDNRTLRFTPSRPLFAGEWVSVNVSSTLLDVNGFHLAGGYSWGFWTGSRATPFAIVEIARIPVRQPGENWIQTYGANAIDLNGDGFSDYAVPNERSNDLRVFMNDGTGTYGPFTIVPLPNASRPSTNEAADFDGDGHADLAIGSTANERVNVLTGNGLGGFSAVDDYPADRGVRGLTVLDLNGDDAPDIVTANRNGSTITTFINRGDGTFTVGDTIDTGVIGESAIAAVDLNEDGLLDLAVGGNSSSQMVTLLSDGQGGLLATAPIFAGGSPWMIAVADINGDGHADVASANSSNGTVALFFGNGQGGLAAPQTLPSGGGFPLAIDLGDLDGDGDLDMMASNYDAVFRLWENRGDGTFETPEDFQPDIAASCAVFHDRDGDGDVDITGIDEMADLLIVFDNPAVTAIEPGPTAPEGIVLRPNYPNPFNPSTHVEFGMRNAEWVHLVVFDIQGQRVATLVDAALAAGHHTVTWNGRDDAGRAMPSGVYLYRLQAGSSVQARKMILMR